jgi:hypothetical protein
MPDLRWVFLVYIGERRHVAITSIFCRALVVFQYSIMMMYFANQMRVIDNWLGFRPGTFLQRQVCFTSQYYLIWNKLRVSTCNKKTLNISPVLLWMLGRVAAIA